MPRKKQEARISDVAVAKAVIAHEAVSCFRGTERKVSVQPRTLVSCVGGVFWGRAEESWPVSAKGQPLFPWLQIVCTEMEGLYGAFYKRKAVCFYLRQDFDGYDAWSQPDQADFVVREYGLADKLEPLHRPDALRGHPFHRVVWKKMLDYPSLGKYHGLFEKSVYDAISGVKRFEYDNRYGHKIGGWPTPIQREQQYPGTYDLQIDSTENYMYGDTGIGYLSRDDQRWYVLFECC